MNDLLAYFFIGFLIIIIFVSYFGILTAIGANGRECHQACFPKVSHIAPNGCVCAEPDGSWSLAPKNNKTSMEAK